MAIRVYVFEEDGFIRQMSYARFKRLYFNDPAECVSEYAGNKIKFALLYLELKQRKPKRIIRMDFQLFAFTPDGRMDEEENSRGAALAVESAWIGLLPPDGNVIDIVPLLAQKKYREEFCWEPTEKERSWLIEKVFYE